MNTTFNINKILIVLNALFIPIQASFMYELKLPLLFQLIYVFISISLIEIVGCADNNKDEYCTLISNGYNRIVDFSQEKSSLKFIDFYKKLVEVC